jgi:hypothetical protein
MLLSSNISRPVGKVITALRRSLALWVTMLDESFLPPSIPFFLALALVFAAMASCAQNPAKVDPKHAITNLS